jgi:hypothetical protein
MKTLLLTLILVIPFLNSNAQGIGELAPDKKPIKFPNNAFGADIMFSDGGLGLGTFYHKRISQEVTLFSDFSISEAKDAKEFDYVDIYGNTYTIGKKNRVFLLPINLGMQYRLFENAINDNLRPYVNIGAGPSIVVTSPYDLEFFKAFGKAQAKVTLGGYIGFGANFGLDKSNLVGLNFRYYIIHFFDRGVESLENRFNKDLGGFFITLNLGFMY